MTGNCAWCGEYSERLNVWGTIEFEGRVVGSDEPLCPGCLESLLQSEEVPR
jgi:hypothetical protein